MRLYILIYSQKHQLLIYLRLKFKNCKQYLIEYLRLQIHEIM